MTCARRLNRLLRPRPVPLLPGKHCSEANPAHTRDAIWSATLTVDVAGSSSGCGNTDPNQAGRVPGNCQPGRTLFGTNSRYVAGRIVTKPESLALAVTLDASTPRYIITERRAGYRVPNPMEREP